MNTSAVYCWFAEYEASGSSPSYEKLALGVADSLEICGLLDTLSPPKRQPNLLLAVVRLLGGPTTWGGFRDFVVDRWDDVSGLMLTRSTQTNEAARCAMFLPVLAQLNCSLALVEVGPSAGLCLYPDRYAYDYSGATIGRSALRIAVDCEGPIPVPTRVPDVVWRAGVDLNPLDVTNIDDMAWLHACVWPEHEQRSERLTAAIAIAAEDPPLLLTGDLLTDTAALLDRAPANAMKVVFHSAVLAYVPEEPRQEFINMMRSRSDVVWLSNEAPGIIPGLETDAEPPERVETPARFHLTIGGQRLLALTDPHGSWLSWL